LGIRGVNELIQKERDTMSNDTAAQVKSYENITSPLLCADIQQHRRCEYINLSVREIYAGAKLTKKNEFWGLTAKKIAQ
jgi:hypothetical protein